MHQNDRIQASRPQFKLERLQDRLLLSAVLEDGTEVTDEVFTEEVPVDEYVEVGDPLCETIVPEGEWSDLIFYTMVGTESELIDPVCEETGEEVYVGGEGEGEVIICTFGELGEEGEILGDPAETVPDEVLMYSTGGPAVDAEVELVAEVAPEEAEPAPVAVDAVSSDLLGSSDDLLGGVVSLTE